MLLQDLYLQVLDGIPECDSNEKIIRAANRVLGQINNLINGVVFNDLALTVGGAAGTGYTWDSTNKRLTVPNTVKRIDEVFLKSGDDYYEFTCRDSDYVLGNDESYSYRRIGQFQIEFAQENSYLTTADNLLYVKGYKVFEKLSSSDTEIDCPGIWEEPIIAGTIAFLTVSGIHADKLLYKMNSEIYNAFLTTIDHWEIDLTSEEMNQRWNYHSLNC